MNSKITKYQKPLLCLFIVYLISMTWIILFKLQFTISGLDYARSINFIPFYGSMVVNGHFALPEIILNSVIFIPCGIYINLLYTSRAFYKKVLFFAGISILYESFQFILAIGRSDITDVIGNCLGGIIGLLIYSFFRKIFKTEHRTNKIILICSSLATIFMIGFLVLLLIVNR